MKKLTKRTLIIGKIRKVDYRMIPLENDLSLVKNFKSVQNNHKLN